MRRRKNSVIFSPVEIQWLKENKSLPLIRLSAELSKSVTSIKHALKQLEEDDKVGKIVPLIGKTKNKRSRIGKRPDCGNLFFRSSYEANVFRFLTRYFDSIKVEFEPEVFYFSEWYRRGTLSYLPDFKLTYKDGTSVFLEAKGYLLPEGKTKLRRFKKHYPDSFQGIIGVTGGPKTAAAKFMKELGFKEVWDIRDMRKEYKDAGLTDWEE